MMLGAAFTPVIKCGKRQQQQQQQQQQLDIMTMFCDINASISALKKKH